jgi:cobalt-zinc-cadmium efflux system outer membrane protein
MKLTRLCFGRRRWGVAAILFLHLHAARLDAADVPADAAADRPGQPVTVEQLVKEVLNRNPERAFYEAELAAARGKRRQAGTWDNPELDAELGGKRVGGNASAEGVAWSVSVRQPFEYPGRMALRKALANGDAALAEMGFAQFQAALAARARVLGHRLLLAQQQAEATRDVAERLQELFNLLVQREPAGITPLIETRIIEAGVVTFRQQAIAASQALQSALFELNALRGQPLGAPLRIAPFDPALPPLPPLEELLKAARENNFELRMRRAELEQQGLQVSLVANQRWPDLSVGPFVSQERAGERETVAGIGVSLPLPLWNRNAGNTEVAQARQQQAATSLYLEQRRVEQSVMEHHLGYRLKREELERWESDAIRRFHEAAELGDRHYRLGALPIATYLELQREYLDAIRALLTLQGEALEAQQALGVLTQISMPPTPPQP